MFLMAWAGEELVGTGALLPEDEATGRIVRMSVARGWRRQGIGRQVLQALLAAARERDYRQVVLETTATWTGAIGFYERMGFRPVGEVAGELHFVYRI